MAFFYGWIIAGILTATWSYIGMVRTGQVDEWPFIGIVCGLLITALIMWPVTLVKHFYNLTK